jgi:hypothetical protein
MFTTSLSYNGIFVDLYIFADQYDILQLRKDLLTTLLRLENLNHEAYSDLTPITNEVAEKVYELLPPSSPMRNYVVRSLALPVSVCVFQKAELVGYPQKFLVDMVCAITARRDEARTLVECLQEDVQDWCDFHEHERDEERSDCQERQLPNGQFYANFLRAVLEEAYRFDKAHE